MGFDIEKCPFCGGEAELHTKIVPHTAYTEIYVKCTRCGARGAKSSGFIDYWTQSMGDVINESTDQTNRLFDAVEVWNERVEGNE